MPSPQVLEGQRAPRAVRLEDIRANTAAAYAQPAALAPEGVTVYVSNARSYLVEVSNKAAYVHDGERIPAKRIAAQFVEGIFRNNDPDPAVRKMIDERLQRNKYFGKFGGGPMVHFWLAAEQNATLEAARLKSALNTLRALPKEVVDAYLRQGSEEDHELSTPAPAAERTAKPIKPVA